MRKLTDYILLTLKGMAMGAADVVPGVSGGTIAFITGIYKEFVESIDSVLPSLKLLFKGKFAESWKRLDGGFLLSVVLGIGISIFSLASLMKFLLGAYPVFTWAFFFGLVAVSAFVILRKVKGWKWQNIVELIAGVALGVIICTLSPTTTPDGLWFIFISGMIAICAMVLPGISGSFILVLLGKYETVIGAVSSLEVATLAVFACGALVGIVSFCRFLSILLARAYNGTIVVMAGFIIGSLVKIWPWSAEQSLAENCYAGLFCLLGILLVVFVEILAAKLGFKGAKI